MIDTHCHLLPALDDGPRSTEEALALADRLFDAGAHTVLCTPHFSRQFPTGHQEARARLREFRDAVARANLPLRLELAAEIGPAAAIDASPDEIRARSTGGGYVLVELSPEAPARLLVLVSSRLADLGLAPVYAHPERCRAVRAQPSLLDSARRDGALVQVVARSLSGPGGGVHDAAWGLLESGRVDVLASDAHRVRHAERLRDALDRAEAVLGRNELRRLTETNPARVLGDEAQ